MHTWQRQLMEVLQEVEFPQVLTPLKLCLLSLNQEGAVSIKALVKQQDIKLGLET